MNNIFVGNLSFEATKEDVQKLFEAFGHVANVLIMEGKKGKSRGYGFVDMPNEAEKNAAIAALAGKEFMWRKLSVSPVVPKAKDDVKKEREPRSTGKFKKSPKPFRREEQAPASGKTSTVASKYYSKFDGPPKPWRKGNPDIKPARKIDKGARPYYGKKDKQGPKPAGTSKLFIDPSKKGFKMHHKVSGTPKSIKSTDGL